MFYTSRPRIDRINTLINEFAAPSSTTIAVDMDYEVYDSEDFEKFAEQGSIFDLADEIYNLLRHSGCPCAEPMQQAIIADFT